MHAIDDLLIAAGVNISGWQLSNATGVSADGTTIVGNGTNGIQQGWIARLPVPPDVVNTHDFNGDGYSDILWLDGSGDVSIWFMNGATATAASAPPGRCKGRTPNRAWRQRSLTPMGGRRSGPIW